MADDGPRVEVTRNGPYRVTGGPPLSRQVIGTDERGQSVEWIEGERLPDMDTYELCRCGRSGHKPYCDGSHERVGFQAEEGPAARVPYLQMAQEQDGPEYTLTDAEPLCAFARFCDADGQVWNLIEKPGGGERAKQEAQHCPGGRLVPWKLDERRALEPELPLSLGLIEDPAQGVSGPLWVRGGIPVVDDAGEPYEGRNRMALCRCGASKNKPFCDGSHAAVGFDDGAVTT
ncbi:CDGSH iron-sulfur domain-containing protein [Actinomadura harenae]|uniref:Iron-binding protein n=1 Tax=Actinomadura harenae TaxID=2483351 RepID=A0A3M2M0N9_9ACTN|nr:CDGSH iron-sulfur domain-containing protein [Actinomadura harenae]RMI43056.1 iron-binding protein [Actinomadura harenae]